MAIELTPCGHLKNVTCPRCKPPASQKQEEFPNQARHITADLEANFKNWADLGYAPSVMAGCLLGAAAGIAQEIGITHEQFLQHLNSFWSN